MWYSVTYWGRYRAKDGLLQYVKGSLRALDKTIGQQQLVLASLQRRSIRDMSRLLRDWSFSSAPGLLLMNLC